MSKILLSVDTETKTILLKVDGQEVSDVIGFGVDKYDKPEYDDEGYKTGKDKEVISVNFSVNKEVKGKNTKTRVYYNLENCEDTEESEAKSKATAELNDISGFRGYELINPNLQESIARFFKS